MATNAAISEPVLGEFFTDRGWRAAFAGQTGVVCDSDGSAFGLTLPAEGATAELGSATQPSRLVVDGYGLEVPQGATQSLDIPASSGGGTNGRTDLIVARLDLTTFTGGPGPVRLDRVPGTEGSTARPAPTYDPDGVRDLPLYAVRRRQGESLNQAIVTDLRAWTGLHFLVKATADLPTDAPLGSTATRAGVTSRRDFVGSSVDWVAQAWPVEVVSGIEAIGNAEGFTRGAGSRIERQGPRRLLHGESTKAGAAITASSSGGIGDVLVATLAATTDRPPRQINAAARVEDVNGATFQAGVHISTTGGVYLNSTNPNVEVRTIIWDAGWRV